MKKDYRELLERGSKKINVSLDNNQYQQLDVYLKQLLFFNKKINLTAITEPRDIVVKHFLDSLSVLSLNLLKENASLVDVGSGAGFPGLVLKIARPCFRVLLLESNRKKSLFLDHMISKLGLSGISTINIRAEDFGKTSGREKYDFVISRAFSSLPAGVELAVPLLKVGGLYLAMKGRPEKELSAENACEELSCGLLSVSDIRVPFLEARRSVFVFQKKAKTTATYPRRSGKPAKSPL